MVTDLRDPHQTYQTTLAVAAAHNLPPERILVPDLLQVNRKRDTGTQASGQVSVAPAP